jgi:hypothetical protein
MYGWSGANSDLEVLRRNGLILDDIIGISNKCAGRGIDFILGGDTNMVVREKDIGAVLPECIDLMESFSTSTGLRSAFIGRFPDEDRKSVYTYSWQGEGKSTSVIDHLFAPADKVLAAGILNSHGRLDSDHNLVLCDYKMSGLEAPGLPLPTEVPGKIFGRLSEYRVHAMRHYKKADGLWRGLGNELEELVRSSEFAGQGRPEALREGTQAKVNDIWGRMLEGCKRWKRKSVGLRSLQTRWRDYSTVRLSASQPWCVDGGARFK